MPPLTTMHNKSWDPEQVRQLKKAYKKKLPIAEISKLLKRTVVSIQSKAHELQISKPREKAWSKREDNYLKKHHAKTSNTELATTISIKYGNNRTEQAVIGRSFVLKLIKDPSYSQMLRAKTQFKKGMIPKNKGKKQTEFMSEEGIKASSATWFKKGSIPANTKKDGAISIRVNNHHGHDYKYIRIKKAKWIQLSQYLWEKAGRKIPKGHFLAFKDGNSLNCILSNLECISRVEGIYRNSSSVHLKDSFVAYTIATKKHPELIPEIMKDKELIELKRQVLILKRTANGTNNGNINNKTPQPDNGHGRKNIHVRSKHSSFTQSCV